MARPAGRGNQKRTGGWCTEVKGGCGGGGLFWGGSKPSLSFGGGGKKNPTAELLERSHGEKGGGSLRGKTGNQSEVSRGDFRRFLSRVKRGVQQRQRKLSKGISLREKRGGSCVMWGMGGEGSNPFSHMEGRRGLCEGAMEKIERGFFMEEATFHWREEGMMNQSTHLKRERHGKRVHKYREGAEHEGRENRKRMSNEGP